MDSPPLPVFLEISFKASYLSGRAALFGRVDQEPAEKLNGLGRRIRDDALQGDGGILLKGDFVVIRQLHKLLQRNEQAAVQSERQQSSGSSQQRGGSLRASFVGSAFPEF